MPDMRKASIHFVMRSRQVNGYRKTIDRRRHSKKRTDSINGNSLKVLWWAFQWLYRRLCMSLYLGDLTWLTHEPKITCLNESEGCFDRMIGHFMKIVKQLPPDGSRNKSSGAVVLKACNGGEVYRVQRKRRSRARERVSDIIGTLYVNQYRKGQIMLLTINLSWSLAVKSTN